MKVKVTIKHIKNGKKRSYTKCPIALAVSDITKCGTFVGSTSVTIDNTNAMYTLPKEAIDFVRNFDNGIAGKPFKFIIDNPR